MVRIIINADDCGASEEVNRAIEKEIVSNGLITSTTIMANMPGFEGALRLYKLYNKYVSFGWHINLDEGEPVSESQILLDCGFFVEKDGKVLLNGGAFRNKFMSSLIRQEVKKELRAQWEKLKDNGVEITHADGHHHIHTAPSMLLIMPSLFKELNIARCRRLRTYNTSGFSYLGRRMWAIPYRLEGIRMTDSFGDFATYYKKPFLRQGSTIELECHPGHKSEKYQNEIEMMHSTDLHSWNAKLISYYEL